MTDDRYQKGVDVGMGISLYAVAVVVGLIALIQPEPIDVVGLIFANVIVGTFLLYKGKKQWTKTLKT